MFQIKASLLLAASLTLASAPGFTQENKKVTLQDLGWMTGCWKAKAGESTVNNIEQWMKPAGNVMLGLGVELKKGKAVSYEYMRIEAQDNGDLVYTVKPHQKPEVSFTLSSKTPTTLVFENPKHDFPQRITYRQETKKPGEMEMRIDGEVKGEKRAAVFAVVKTSCE